MSGDPEREKMNELAARIRLAEGAAKRVKETPRGDAGDTIKASRLGFDFVATVVVCVAAGWGIDRQFGTGPWGVLVMLVAGFAAAMVKMWRSLNGKK